MAKWSGGCACGAIRFECDADPVLMLNCHCRDCQQATGTAYAAILALPKAAVRLSGEPRYHRRLGDSGHAVERGFCPSCGSPLCGNLERFPDLFMVRAGSLDDPSRFEPAMDIFTESAHRWDHMGPEIPKHPRGMGG
jgi:hypothetical protein